ncbi:putative U6 snRNA-associated Sm-like protein LSm2 [Blattamonas nauphoetae]|uniref:U6 snRNA-associated Sm-like protein LSm2 n=1 Tax=Blattamonas nauphoetae TaxID=2049346 RepID=A0ABQ9XWJ4_9EUKA|nr:putative U6 snRNA-associated Sm-like protein LSm2 [Blattamonas nauphoetae]
MTLFSGMFEALIGKKITIEMKNDLSFSGTLNSVDKYMNMVISDLDKSGQYETTAAKLLNRVFVRGSDVRYAYLDRSAVDVEQLEELTRKEGLSAKS